MTISTDGFSPIQEAPAADETADDNGGLSVEGGEGFSPELPSEEQAALEQSVYSVRDVNPDEHASAIALAQKTGLPVDTVARNKKEVEHQQALDGLKGLADSAPSLAEWASQPDNAAVAKDDFDALGLFESWYKQLTTGFKKGNLEAKLAELRTQQLSETRATKKQSTRFQTDIDQIKKDLEPLSAVDQRVGGNFHPLYQAASQLPNMSRAFVKGDDNAKSVLLDQQLEENPESLFYGPQSFAPEVIAGTFGVKAGPATELTASGVAAGSMAGPGGAMFGARMGAVAGMAKYAYEVEAGSAYDEYLGLTDKAGNPIDPVKAAEAAHMVGLINASLETTGELILAKTTAPFAKAIGGSVAEVAAKALSKVKVPGAEKIAEVIASQPKAFAGMTLKKAILEAGKLFIEGELGEMSTEYLQEVATGAGGDAAKVETAKARGQSISDFELSGPKKTFADATGVLYPTFQATIPFGLAGGVGHVKNEIRNMRMAEGQKQAYLAMGKTAEASKLRERLPEGYKNFVEQVTKNGPVDSVFIPADAFQTYFQGKNIDPVAAASEIGVSEKDLADAHASNGFVKVPLGTWAEKAVNTEHFQGLADDVTFNPEVPTVNQVKQAREHFEGQVNEHLQSAAPEIQKGVETAQGAEAVYRHMNDAVLAARPESMSVREWKVQADKAARLWAARSKVVAAGQGISVQEAFDQMRPAAIEAGGVAVPVGALTQGSPRGFKPEVLSQIRDEVARAKETFEPGGLKTDDQGNVTGRYGPTNAAPEYFKGRGYKTSVALSAIEKAIAGEKLTDGQQKMVEDLYLSSGHDREYNQRVARSQWFMQPELGEFSKGGEKDQTTHALPESVKVTEPADHVKVAGDLNDQKSIKAQVQKLAARGTFINEQTKWPITANAGTYRKAIDYAGGTVKSKNGKFAQRAHLEALQNIGKLLENAVYLTTEPERKGRSDVSQWHYLFAPLKMDGKDYLVKLEVAEKGGKYQLHNYALVDPRGLADNLPYYGTVSGDAVNQPAGSMSISDFTSQVKAGREKYTYFQAAPSEFGFYSKLERTVEEKMGNSATVEQVNGLLRDVKGEERKWSGIDEFLKGKEKVSKSELQEFLRANQLEIQEVTKGGQEVHSPEEAALRKRYEELLLEEDDARGRFHAAPRDSDARAEAHADLKRVVQERESVMDQIAAPPRKAKPKFQQYTLPGGENYREVLFTLPDNSKHALYDKQNQYMDELHKKYGDGWRNKATNEERRRVDDLGRAAEEGGEPTYRSSHFDEANVLAHVRLDDRTDADGKRVLFVEEIQSDWHQEGRKKGYSDAEHKELTELPSGYEVTEYKPELRFGDGEGQSETYWNVTSSEGRQLITGAATREEAIASTLKKLNREAKTDKVPDAPFRKTWHEFALKRVLRMAAEERLRSRRVDYRRAAGGAL
jgi:hypothetical protein